MEFRTSEYFSPKVWGISTDNEGVRDSLKVKVQKCGVRHFGRLRQAILQVLVVWTFFVLCHSVRGSIVVDASTSANTSAASVLSFSHNIGNGGSRMLLVAVSMASFGGKTVSGVSYGGQALTLVGAKKHGNDRVRVE